MDDYSSWVNENLTNMLKKEKGVIKCSVYNHKKQKREWNTKIGEMNEGKN